MTKKKSNKKGFSLIEVLAVIVIIGIITSIAFAVYINVIDKSKNISINLAMNNIRDAAELYIKESFNDSGWNTLDESNQYACITISELINAGYFKENFYKDELYNNTSINSNTYISIVRNIMNKADLEIKVLDDNINTNEQCQTTVTNEVINTEFKESNREIYTDTINFKNTSLPDDTFKYKCAIKKASDKSWINFEPTNEVYCFKEGLDGLSKYNGEYTLKVCLGDGTIEECSNVTDETKSFEKNIKLSDFETPIITFDPDTELSAYRNVTITYSNNNIYKEEGYHYFKSTISGILEEDTEEEQKEIYTCAETNIENINSSNCTTKATSIEANKVYYTSLNEVTFKINQNISTTNEKVYAYIKDKSNNHKETYKTIPKINTTIPTCEIVLTGTKGNNGYYKSNVTVKLNTGAKNGVTATLSGLVAGGSNKKPTNRITTATITNSISTTYYGYVKYSNGAESTCKKTLKIDKEAPSCSIKMIKSTKENMSSSSNYDGSWYDGYVRTSPNCTDKGGSGCSESYKVKVNAKDSNSTGGTFSGKFRTVTGQGKTIHTWTVSDNAGNTKECSAATIKLDRTGPSCTANKSNTKTTSGVTAKFSCTDKPTGVSNSGVASCTGTKTGLKGSNSYQIKDKAGNTGTCKVTISKQNQTRYKNGTRVCKRCSKAGCETPKTCATSACGTYVTYGSWKRNKSKDFAVKTGCKNPSYTKTTEKADCYSVQNTCSPYQCFVYTRSATKKNKSCPNEACGCKKYKENCSKCGTDYIKWEKNWSSWSTNSCKATETKKCESRTVYY